MEWLTKWPAWSFEPFLQAQKLGFAILTANLAEFDLHAQLVPAGRLIFYRAGA